MGYTTWFTGGLKFNKPVTEELRNYINRFSKTRRMPRDNDKIKEIYPNWRELCFMGELGNKGEYFALDPKSTDWGQNHDDSILDYNGFKGAVHPGLWCQWVINDDDELVWDQGEKFYCYEEWLNYLIKHFFEPLGYVLNGDIEWQGEESEDFGVIHVEDNDVEMQYGFREPNLEYVATDALVAELESRGYNVGV